MDKSICKLIEMVSAGVGAIAGPMLASWKARKHAEAFRIEANGRVEVKKVEAAGRAEAQAIFTQAQEMFSSGTTSIKLEDYVNFQNHKRVQNIKDIVEKTADILVDQPVVEKDQIDPDWAARYFGNAQDVSSEELKQLWAKILARETVKSGQTSLRTLDIIRNMSSTEAKSFESICPFVIGLDICHKLKGFNAPLALLVEMESWGLINASHEKGWIFDKKIHSIVTKNRCIRLTRQKESMKLVIPVYRVLSPGIELFDVFDVKVDEKYLDEFLRYADSKYWKVETCQIIKRDRDENGKECFEHSKWMPYSRMQRG